MIEKQRMKSGCRKKMITGFLAIICSCLLSASVLISDLHAADKLPKVKLSVKPLDLSKPLSREAIMAAGQLGGQLYPTHEVEDSQREKSINTAFGAAIQEWNKHEYKKAVKLFREHMEEYPDSPWAAEAVLHIGCDAQYTGRYSEAEESFFWILEKFKGKDHEGAKKMVHKAKLRLAVLKVAENNFDEAGRLFSDLHQSSDDWRDRTYASHWIQRLSRYKSDKLAMLNCGALALARVLEKQGKEKEAREVAAMLPASFPGYNMQDLMDIAAGYGYEFVGLRVAADELDKLPLPAIVQLSSRNAGDSGHYWTLEKVRGDEVELFDPQAGRRFNQTVAEFAREWDGAALALQAGGTPLAAGTIMSKVEIEARYGGCCGAPRPEEDLGDPEEPDEKKKKKKNCSKGAPSWTINKVNMNLFVTDTPNWYEPPIGPPVRITLSYNSQSSIAYNQPFGNKWQFNYNSYLIVDTGGQVIVFMPDGRNDIYSPDGSGGYTSV
jgi:tetratricopeptide (TPR) repeat protein